MGVRPFRKFFSLDDAARGYSGASRLRCVYARARGLISGKTSLNKRYVKVYTRLSASPAVRRADSYLGSDVEEESSVYAFFLIRFENSPVLFSGRTNVKSDF